MSEERNCRYAGASCGACAIVERGSSRELSRFQLTGAFERLDEGSISV